MVFYIRNEVDDLIGLQYNTDKYYYLKNAQNNIIGILDSNYNIVAKYTYDAWGNILSITDGNGIDISNNDTHIGNINPFRYRSYYYDKETNLYYLNSRYYNPVWGRFINGDSNLGANKDINSYNLYTYVSNNPINMCDPSGQFGIILGCVIIGGVAGAIAGGMVDATNSKAKTGKVQSSEVIKGATTGGVLVGLAVGSLGYAATALLNPETKDAAQQGYDTFSQLKENLPKPAPGNQYHHIVEQSQITKSGFDPKMIHNVNNITEISKDLHYKISGYYSSIQDNINSTMRVRDYLTGQSFDSQYEFGIKVIKMFKG